MELEIVCKMIADVLGVDPNEITPESTIMSELGADSLDLYQIMMKIEEEFEIKLDEQEALQVKNVKQLMALIQNSKTESEKSF